MIFTTFFMILTGAVLVLCVQLGSRRVGRLALIAPCTIFFGGILARYGVGSLITVLTPEEWVLKGEYSQYLVTWRFIDETSRLWAIYVMSSFLALAATYGCLHKVFLERVRGREISFIECYRRYRLDAVPNGLKSLIMMMLVVFFLESVVGVVTGSADRGSSYVYWASQTFKPISAFIAVSRIRQLVFLLLPIAVSRTTSVSLKRVMVLLGAGTLVLGFISGGRGSVLYPVVMVWIGWILSGAKKRNIVRITLTMITAIVIAIPAIATYRDSPVLMRKASTDVVGRAMGLVTQFDIDRFRYRVQAIGREMYACSDAFLFLDRNSHLREVGYSDIDVSLVKKILLPRVLSDNKQFEKNDGSTLAKKSIGVINKTWFPCITTPADLWRRGGYVSVIYGGVVIGVGIGILQMVWEWIAGQKKSLLVLLLVLFPATYIHYGVYGTIREIVWQIGWELPKYIILLTGLGLYPDIVGWVKMKGNGK